MEETNEISREDAIARIDEDLRDSGNGNYSFDTLRYQIEDDYSEAVAAGDEFVFIKPPSGYELEIEVSVVGAALS